MVHAFAKRLKARIQCGNISRARGGNRTHGVREKLQRINRHLVGRNSNITDWLANVDRCLRPQVGINVRHGGFVEHDYCASFSMNGDKGGIILVESYRLSLRVERRVPLLKLRKRHGKLLMKGTSG